MFLSMTSQEMNKPDYKKAKETATKILSDHGYLEPPVNPIDICTALGIKISFKDFGGDPEVLAAYFGVQFEDENSIYVNTTHSIQAQFFAIAYQLGHRLMHKSWTESDNYRSMGPEELEIPYKCWRSQEAHCFANNLLVPKFMLDKHRHVASIDELAKLFMVSRTRIRIMLYEHSFSFRSKIKSLLHNIVDHIKSFC